MKRNKETLKTKSFIFSLETIKLYKKLKEKKEYVLSRQLLRSGTSVGAMIREAKNAESRADFIHKLGIAQKECAETIYWLELLYESNYLDKDTFDRLHCNATELLKMIRSSILTTKNRS